MFEGSLLAVDVGGGTQDILIWEPSQPLENAVKMVLPAPTQILARKIRGLTKLGQPLFLRGRLMGGGAVTQAVRRHLAQGLPVYATPQVAYTLSDRLDLVQEWGVTLTEAPPAEAPTLTLGDVDVDSPRRVLAAYGVPFPTHYAVAVQDHGFHPEGSNRRFRFRYWENFLQQGGELAALAYRSPPFFHPDVGRGRNLARGLVDGYLHRGGAGGAARSPGPGAPASGPHGGESGQCPYLRGSGAGGPFAGDL